MDLEFFKLQTSGNDFILLNKCMEEKKSLKSFASMAKRMCPYHTGIGAKGLIVLVQGMEHRIGLHLFGPDGKESRLLNDAVICAGRYLFDNGFIADNSIVIETAAGITTLTIIDSRNFRLSLGNPMTLGGKESLREISDDAYSRRVVLNDKSYNVTPLFLQINGAVVLVENLEKNQCHTIVRQLGKSDASFADAMPIFTTVLSRDEIRLSVYPKKNVWDIAAFSGIAAVGAIVNGFIERDCVVAYDDANLFVHWNEKDDQVYVTASSDYVFTGAYYYED